MQDRLTIDRPAALGETLAHAVRAVCAHPIDISCTDLVLLDARLAAGDFESVLALLRLAPAAPALPLFAARYVRWTGDLQSAAAIWNNVLASLDEALDERVEPSLRRASCTELAATAADLGDAQLAARLHGIARTTAVATALRPPGDASAELVCDTAFDTLGIEPDAARGRLRLRPRLDRLRELHARNIRFADGSVSLRAVRTDADVTIRIEQDAGSIPFTVLLEPFVLRPHAASVDGQPADLVAQLVTGRRAVPGATPGGGREAAGTDGGTIVPVQLVLDGARTFVIDTEP